MLRSGTTIYPLPRSHLLRGRKAPQTGGFGDPRGTHRVLIIPFTASHYGILNRSTVPTTIFFNVLPQNPAFGPAQLKSLVPIFNQKAAELQSVWLSQLNENNVDTVELDVTIYIGRATLDIIGLAGWNVFIDKRTFL